MAVLSERQKRELEIYADIESIGGMGKVSEPPDDEAVEVQTPVSKTPMSFAQIKARMLKLG